MTSRCQVNSSVVDCSCGGSFSSDQLHFCRKCNSFKCSTCISEEFEVLFCPYCRNDLSISQAEQSQNKCSDCRVCPRCDDDNRDHLECKMCKWTSRDAGMADKLPSANWPEQMNLMEEDLSKVLKQMKNMSRCSMLKPKEKSYLVVGKAEDDFRIQPCSDPPVLADSTFEKTVNSAEVLTLAQVLKQPISCESSRLFPTKVTLMSKSKLRCADCKSLLLKNQPKCANFRVR